MKKLLKNYLKVTATLIFWFVITNTVEAEAPISFTQISGNASGDILGITFLNSNSLLVTGNFSNFKTLSGTDVPAANGTVQISTTGTISPQNGLGNLVTNPHIEKCNGNIFLIGDNGGDVKIYQMISNSWVLKQTIIGGSVVSTGCAGSKIGIVGTFQDYLAFYNTKTNTLTKSAHVLDGPGEIKMSEKYSIVKCEFPISSAIIDNTTEQLSVTVPFPSGLAMIKGIAAGNQEDLMISGTTFLDPVTYIWDSTNSMWIKIADHNGSGYFGAGWFDTDHTLYLRHSGGYINGVPMGGFVIYKNNNFTEQFAGSTPVQLAFSANFVIFTGIGGIIYAGEKTSTPTGIKNNSTKEKVSLYPNPTTDKIVITSPEAREIPLLALNGQIINIYQVKKNEPTTIDVSDLANGSYYFGTTQFVVSK